MLSSCVGGPIPFIASIIIWIDAVLFPVSKNGNSRSTIFYIGLFIFFGSPMTFLLILSLTHASTIS